MFKFKLQYYKEDHKSTRGKRKIQILEMSGSYAFASGCLFKLKGVNR